jgi:hypothetical protein
MSAGSLKWPPKCTEGREITGASCGIIRIFRLKVQTAGQINELVAMGQRTGKKELFSFHFKTY